MWHEPNILLEKLKDSMTNYVMVTGAAGYIGGQTALMLKDQGYEVIGVDQDPAPELLENVFTHYFQSDFADKHVLDVIEPQVELVEASGAFVRPAGDGRPWRADNPLPVPTERERHVIEQGLPVYRVLYRRGRP